MPGSCGRSTASACAAGGDNTYRGVFYYIDDRGTDLTGLCVLSGFLLAGGVIALLMLVPGTIIWFASPNVAALRYILDLI